jgi:hypothetical protein
MEKKCANCGLEKDLKEFSKDKHQKDGYTYSCKDCRNKKYNEWAKNNKDKVREKNAKRWESRKSYYQSEEGIKSSRRAHLKRMFGMTLEEYNVKLEEQNGVCDICSEPEKSVRNNFLCVDHSHDNDNIRGLLCTNCNRAIGLLKDNIEILENAIKYLKKHKTI